MLLLVNTAEAAGVNKNFNSTGEQAFAPVFGTSLPPIGFVQFCARQPEDCRAIGDRATEVALTPSRWNLLNQVNKLVNRKIAPMSDIELHQVPELWTVPTEAGDCEDYVLLKKRYLEGLGFPAETLLITVVLDEVGEGHAVLTVHTDKGDFVLDNRRGEVLRWAETHYQFLKRQSQQNPGIWVALTNKSTRNQGAIAGGN
jgi:predicted transglutaminase-like cysteine proteinase